MNLFDAISSGDLDSARALATPETLADRHASGATAAQWALYHGQRELAEELAQRSAFDFHTSVCLGQTEQVLAHLSDHPEAADSLSADGFTPLCLAAAFQRPEVVEALLDAGADANLRSTALNKVAPIHSAVFGRNFECLDRIVRAGADVHAEQEGGFTALQGAIQNGDAAAEALLREYGAKK